MVAVTDEVRNPLIEQHPSFFTTGRFWPAYLPLADNLMRSMHEAAMAARQTRRSPRH
jgi:hypothetical protein